MMRRHKLVGAPPPAPAPEVVAAEPIPPRQTTIRKMSNDAWLCIALAVVSIVAFIALAVSLYHTTATFYVNGLPLDGTNARLSGTVDFQCSASRIQYTMRYAVPPAETVTRLRFEFSADVGPGAPDPVPLCQNAGLDPVNPYEGPPCPSEIPCVGKACYEGVLSASGGSAVIVESGFCEQLEGSETRLILRLYTDMHPAGIAVGSLVRHTTT